MFLLRSLAVGSRIGSQVIGSQVIGSSGLGCLHLEPSVSGFRSPHFEALPLPSETVMSSSSDQSATALASVGDEAAAQPLKLDIAIDLSLIHI